MYFSLTLRSLFKAVSFSVLAGITLLSCSSTQNFYDDDEIYNSGTSSTVQERAGEVLVQSQNTSKYKDFFQNGARQLEDIPEEGAIFTDIEEYNSESEVDYNEEYVGEETYQEGKSAWGEETGNSIVYVYNSSPFYGYNSFGYGGFGYGRFGYGYNSFGWPYYGGFGYSSFGYGYNNFGYGYNNFGYGYIWNPFYYGNSFYNRPYFNGAYNGYEGTAIAYNSSNRSSVSKRGRISAADAVADSRSRLRSSTKRGSVSRARTTYSRNRGTVRKRPSATQSQRRSTSQTKSPNVSKRSQSSVKRPSTSSSKRSSANPSGSSRSKLRSSSKSSRSSSSSNFSSGRSGSRGSSRGGSRRG